MNDSLRKTYLDACAAEKCRPFQPVLKLLEGRIGSKLFLRGDVVNDVTWEVPSQAQLLAFTKYLKSDTLITELDMSYNRLNEDILVAIRDVISTNSQLTCLKMSQCQFEMKMKINGKDEMIPAHFAHGVDLLAP